MHGVATEKVPGGKLLRIKVDYSDKIERVQITGDFFLHPEDKLLLIEESLRGLKTDEEEARIADIVNNVVASSSIQLVGIDPQSIARTLKRAVKNEGFD